MKSKIYLSFHALLFICLTANAQSVSYSILTDEPDDYKNVSISLEPFNADFYMSNATIGWDVRADALLLKRFDIRGEYKKSYLDVLTSTQSIGHLPSPTGGLEKCSNMELGGTFYFYAKTKSRSIKITLSSSQSGNYTYTKYIMVPAHKRVMWGLRGGVFAGKNNIHITENQAQDFYCLNKANNKDTMRIGDFTNTTDGYDTYGAYSALRNMTLYAGITHRTITNLVIKTDSYRKKGNRMMTDIYFDYLIAPVLSMQDVMTTTKVWSVETMAGIKQRTGWRVGFAFRGSVRPYLSFKTEFGSKPGIILKKEVMSKYYINLNMGLNIPLKIKITPKPIADKPVSLN
jgi:hypothetical protein